MLVKNINKLSIILILLFLSVNTVRAAGYYHLLSGGGGGYQFSIFQAKSINDMISAYNNQENRVLWDGIKGEKMSSLNLMHGYFARYAFYKYIDKSGDYLSTYQISGEFDHSFAAGESWFAYKFAKVYRKHDYVHNSISLSFDYGFSPVNKLLLYSELSIGYDHFSVESYLEHPDNLTRAEVIIEETRFNSENIALKNGLKIQDGKFSGDGISLKSELRAEYFILPELETNFAIAARYLYIDRLKKNKENLRKNQFSVDPLVLEAMQYKLRLGLNYYFVLE